MTKWNLWLVLIGMLSVSSWLALEVGSDGSRKARQVHFSSLVLDTHIDTTLKLKDQSWDFSQEHTTGHVDLPRLKKGGLDGAFFSIYMPGTVTGPQAVNDSLERIASVYRLVELHKESLVLCTSASEVRRAGHMGKVAVLLGMEGGHMINNSLHILRMYAQLGIRYLTLTHSVNTGWADSSNDSPVHGGLTEFGQRVVEELNRLGVLVDVSHVSDDTFWDAVEVSEAPMIASHSSCRALSNHRRNMSDEMIKALGSRGGVIQITFVDQFLATDHQSNAETLRKQGSGGNDAGTGQDPVLLVDWEKIVDHIDHAVQVAGVEHVGLGSDFDGADMPSGMEDVTFLPKITKALLERGYEESQVRGILGENTLSLLQKVESVSQMIRVREESK